MMAAWLLLGLGVPRVLAAAEPDSKQAATQILSASRYQTQLPGDEAPPVGLPGAAGTSQDHGKGSVPPDESASPHPSDPPPGNGAATPPHSTFFNWITHAASPGVVALLRLLPAILLAALIIALLVFAFLRFQNRHRVTAAQEIAPSPPVTAPVIQVAAPLAPWQKLAEQGRFTEAIHLLLLQVLQQLHQERLIASQQSQTSREILNGGSLPPQRRAGLATIIGAVEYCHFGGRPAGAQLFERCVDAYQQVSSQQVLTGMASDVRPA